MTKLIEAIYNHGTFKPIKLIKLPERQKVILAVAINDTELPSLLISKLAERSRSFQFLNNPEEDIYSLSDGEKV